MPHDNTDRERRSQTARPKEAPVSRRSTLAALAGAMALGTAGTTGASGHDAVVVEGSDTEYATETADGTVVYAGDDYIDAIQAGVDSLSDDRTAKETVLVDTSGNTGSHSWDGDVKAVDLDSYTVVEMNGTMTVDDTGDDLIVPFRAQSVESIELRNVAIRGNPRYGVWIQSCSDVTLGTVDMSLYETEDVGIGVRIDDSDGSRTDGVSLDYAYVEGSASHAVETYGVDGFDVGTAEAVDAETGSGLLLNDTTDATIQEVDALRCDQGGGYAGFRCANGAGPNITVDKVTAVDCGRGIFTVSGSEGITISDVYVEGCETGALIQDTRDTVVDGGTIADSSWEGVRIDSRDDDEYHHTRNVTVRNLDVTGNGTYGVYETGPYTEENEILDNYFCNNGDADIETYADSTRVSGNEFCDGGGDGGSNAPVASVDSFAQRRSNNPHAEFVVDWSASDVDADLDTVEVSVTNLDTGETLDTISHDVAGDTAAGSDEFKDQHAAGSGDTYEAEVVVTDGAGNTATDTATLTEG